MIFGKKSLFATLALWFGLSAFLLVLLSTVYLYWSFATTLRKQDSQLLADRLQTIRLLLSNSVSELGSLKERVEEEWARHHFERLFVLIEDENHKVLALTPGVKENDPIFDNPIDFREKAESVGVFSLLFGNQPIFRSMGAKFPDPAKTGSVISVRLVLDRSAESKVLAGYRDRLLFVLSVSLLFCAFVGWRLSRRAVRPINQMADASARIRSSTLHERLSLEDVPIEIANLSKTYNEMLDRLEESFSRLSQFSADIAHELRTPISNLAGEIEVALRKNREMSFYQDVMGSALEECERLSRIIDSLLFIARAEDPKLQLTKEKVRVRKELETVLDFYDAAATEAGISYSLDVPSDLELDVERTLFQRAVGNCIANSIRHTGRHGQMNVRAKIRDTFAEIEISDTGKGIDKRHLPHIFNRFYRVDESRSKDSGGSGLGLAIVKTIANLHGGSVGITSEVEKGTTVLLTFPSNA